jgi:hyperosmotically inducible periplasmic protein
MGWTHLSDSNTNGSPYTLFCAKFSISTANDGLESLNKPRLCELKGGELVRLISGARLQVNGATMRMILVALFALAASVSALGQQAQPSPDATLRITKEVRHELVMLPYFSVFDNLAYKVDGYNVTLMGQVTRPTLKSDAENVVKRIEGVEHVDNQIEVLPPSPNDDHLRRQLYRAIYGYPALQKYALGVQQPIRIIVKNGNVTLEGVVDNEADKNIANIRARSVPGTFNVINNLQVALR